MSQPARRFKLLLSRESHAVLKALKKDKGAKTELKAVTKALKFLEINPRHNSLRTRKYRTLSGPDGEDVFEAYAQAHRPGAYRIFWYYGDKKGTLKIFNIVPHPK